MKKICFITTISFTLKSFILETAKYLHLKGGYNITFICNNDEDFKNSLPNYINFIPVSMKRGIGFDGISAIFKLYNIFKTENFDIIQYSTPNASLYCSIASLIAGNKIRIYHLMGLRFETETGCKKKLLYLLEKLTCKLSSHIECVSKSCLDFSCQLKLFNNSEAKVIWNGSTGGVDLDRFDFSKKQIYNRHIRNKFCIDENIIIFGFVGRITKDKGINEILAAYKKLNQNYKNTKLFLIGGFEEKENLDENLLSWATDSSSVIFSGGFVDNVEEYFSALDIFVFPSYREGFGNVVIEAEAMGCPVIVSNITGPIDAMVENQTGLIVNKADVEDLYNKMLFLYENSEIRKKMSIEAMKYARENFDSKILFEKILEDRDELLKK